MFMPLAVIVVLLVLGYFAEKPYHYPVDEYIEW
jgi:hypothetical protein